MISGTEATIRPSVGSPDRHPALTERQMARAAVLTYSAMLLVRHYRYDLRQSMASRTCKRALRHQLKECWEALKDRSEPVWAGRTAVRRSQKGKWRAAAAPFTDRSTSCWVAAPCTSPDFSKFGDRARISLDSPSHAAHDAACVALLDPPKSKFSAPGALQRLSKSCATKWLV